MSGAPPPRTCRLSKAIRVFVRIRPKSDSVPTANRRNPDAVGGRQVVKGFALIVVADGNTADADVVREGIEKAPSGQAHAHSLRRLLSCAVGTTDEPSEKVNEGLVFARESRRRLL